MKPVFALALALVLAGCATAKVAMTEPRRVVGTENGVRVDAEITGDELQSGGQVPITYAIRNERSQAIAIAELIPETAYDAESHMMTVGIGSEVPGTTFLPRLIVIAPGETKTFKAAAKLRFAFPRSARGTPATELRLKVNFLGDTSGRFQELIGIPEKGVADPKLADVLFPLWLERNEVVYTNAVPMRWKAMPEPAEPEG